MNSKSFNRKSVLVKKEIEIHCFRKYNGDLYFTLYLFDIKYWFVLFVEKEIFES